MSSISTIDLSSLPSPSVVEELDFEVILRAMRDDLVARFPAIEPVIDLESEPARKLLEVCAYRELLLRQRVNEAARSVMLAYAIGSDLDQIAANYDVSRFVLDPGDLTASPPVSPTYESDTELRRRVQLSFEGFSTAGPVGAYVFHALSADPGVLDVSVASPEPGEVVVSILARDGDGTASAELVASVADVLSAEDVRPLTDHVTVQSAVVVPYSVEAVLTVLPGPDGAVILEQANEALAAYIAETQRLGRDVVRSGLFAALHRPGVQNVSLIAPAADIVIADAEASFCVSTDVTIGGVDE